MLTQGDSHSSPELSRKDESVRMILLCKQRGKFREGIQLLEESWGMMACKMAQRIHLDGDSLIHKSILKKQRYSGVANPMVQMCRPTKIPGIAEEFPGSRVVPFMDPLCSSRSVKGLQQWQKMGSDLN